MRLAIRKATADSLPVMKKEKGKMKPMKMTRGGFPPIANDAPCAFPETPPRGMAQARKAAP
jgi:hypothetical protein